MPFVYGISRYRKSTYAKWGILQTSQRTALCAFQKPIVQPEAAVVAKTQPGDCKLRGRIRRSQFHVLCVARI